MTSRPLLFSLFASSALLLVLAGFYFTGDKEPAPPGNVATAERNVVPVPVQPPVAAPRPAEVIRTQEPAPVSEPALEAPEVVVELAPAPPQPRQPPLPALDASDPFVRAQLNDMANVNAIVEQLDGAQIIRKFVVLVDGMSRGDIPSRDLPVMRPGTELAVTDVSEEFYRLDPASYARFNLLVNTFAAMDNAKAVSLFERMMPLFDAAYAELGYPDRSFDNVLREAMNNVLAVRLPTGEILLTRPSVNYHFADPALESRTDLEKLLIRMGPDNTAKIQRKVRELRALLAD